jgi:hypothetical protein
MFVEEFKWTLANSFVVAPMAQLLVADSAQGGSAFDR